MAPFSHKIITVKCDANISDKCLNTWQCKLSEIAVKRQRGRTNKDYCVQCCYIVNQGGNKSHFSKYIKDETYFSVVDSEDKAYFLGWLASDGHIRRKRFTIKLSDCDSYILETFSKAIKSDIPVHHKLYDGKMWAIFDVSSMKMTKDLIRLLNISFGPKDYTVCMPQLSDELTWHFLRGLFEGDGHVPKINSKRCRITIASVSQQMKTSIKNFLDAHEIKTGIYKKTLAWHGVEAVKLIDKMYSGCNQQLFISRKRDACIEWENYTPQTKKLNQSIANDIRKLRNEGVAVKDLMKQFRVGKSTIYGILNNEYYKN